MATPPRGLYHEQYYKLAVAHVTTCYSSKS